MSTVAFDGWDMDVPLLGGDGTLYNLKWKWNEVRRTFVFLSACSSQQSIGKELKNIYISSAHNISRWIGSWSRNVRFFIIDLFEEKVRIGSKTAQIMIKRIVYIG